MGIKEIAARLVAIHSALVEKTGEQPFVDPMIEIRQSGIVRIGLYRSYNNGDFILKVVDEDSIPEALDAADAFIAAMPDRADLAKRDFQRDLGKVIEKGEGINAPKDVMSHLRSGMTAMTENLLGCEVTK